MIYCVVPQALEDELYDKLVDYYKDEPNVKVIVDRRDGPDRRAGEIKGPDDRRTDARPPSQARHGHVPADRARGVAR